MVGSIHHKAKQLLFDQQGGDHGDIRQMCSTHKGVINNHQISGMPLHTRDNLPHGEGHTAQMDRNVSSLSRQLTRCIKDSAGVVQTVSDIGRKCGSAQYSAHLITHRLYSAGKNCKLYRIHKVANATVSKQGCRSTGKS